MAIRINNIAYIDKFRTAVTDVDWLLANIGEPLDIEIDFTVEISQIAQSQSTDESDWFYYQPSPSLVNLTNTDGLIWAENSEAFAEFYVGDTINISGSPSNVGNFTIIDKRGNQGIVVLEPLTGRGLYKTGTIINVTTSFAGIKYYWNLIENSEAPNYLSRVTGEEQMAKVNNANAASTTPITMVLNGNKDYQIDSITIEGIAAYTYSQAFTIKHSTVVTPLFIESQYNDLLARTKPSYFEAGNCLKHIFKIEANRDLSNPNDLQTIEYNERLGETGWFNENYNGGSTNYSYSNLVITRVSDSATLDALELSSACDVTFDIDNTTDSPFSSLNTKSMALFWQLPEQDNYTQNGRNLQQNFVYDYAQHTLDAATSVGSAYNVAIAEFETVILSASKIACRIRVSLNANSQGYVNENANKRYLLGFMVENHALTRETSDKVNLLLNVNDFEIQLYNSNLISNTTQFLNHRFNSFADGISLIEAFPTDDLVSYSEFNIDFNGLESDGINILNVAHELVLTHPTNAEIKLESNVYTTTASQFLSGYVPLIDVEQNREFRLSDGDFRKLVDITRDSANDSGTIYAYKTTYPFFVRWETWEALSGVTNPPSGVYDTTLPNNGLNHYWYRYQTLGYELNYRLKFTILQNGEQFNQEFDSAIIMHPFDDNAEWGNETIKSYDVDSATELVSGGNKFLQSYTSSKLVASFEKVSGTLPDIADVDIVFWGIVKENGNIKSVVRFSSVYDDNGNTFFSSTDGLGYVVKNKTGSVYTGEVLVDYTKLPSASDFTIYARIYDNPPFGCPADGISTEADVCILTEDELNLIQE